MPSKYLSRTQVLPAFSRTPAVQRWLPVTRPSLCRLQCSEKPPGSATGRIGRCDRCEGARPSVHSVQLGTAILQRLPCTADSQNCPWALGERSDCPGQEPAGTVSCLPPTPLPPLRSCCTTYPSAVALWDVGDANMSGLCWRLSVDLPYSSPIKTCRVIALPQSCCV